MKLTFTTAMTIGLALSASGQTQINPIEILRGATAKQHERNASPNDPRALMSWNVTLDGTSNGRAFHRMGRLILVVGSIPRIEAADLPQKAQPNNIHLLLVSGHASQPETGAIEFASHTYLHREAGGINSFMVELADVREQVLGDVMRIETRAAGPQAALALGRNGFASPETGEVFLILDGTLSIQISAQGELTGTAQLGGKASATSAASYTARITGTVSGMGMLEMRSLPVATLPAGLKM